MGKKETVWSVIKQGAYKLVSPIKKVLHWYDNFLLAVSSTTWGYTVFGYSIVSLLILTVSLIFGQEKWFASVKTILIGYVVLYILKKVFPQVADYGVVKLDSVMLSVITGTTVLVVSVFTFNPSLLVYASACISYAVTMGIAGSKVKGQLEK